MGEDRSVPGTDAIKRHELYLKALRLLAEDGNKDAQVMCYKLSYSGLIGIGLSAFLSAVINYDRKLLEKMNPHCPFVDLVDLADRVKSRVVVLRLES